MKLEPERDEDGKDSDRAMDGYIKKERKRAFQKIREAALLPHQINFN